MSITSVKYCNIIHLLLYR